MFQFFCIYYEVYEIVKKLYFTFYTTADAIAMEELAKKNLIRGRLTQIPRKLSAGCGLSFETETIYIDELKKLVEENGIECEQIKEIDIN